MGDVVNFPSEQESPQKVADDYFGVCPECGKSDGYINAGRSHWFICKEHKIKWLVGCNLFSDWRHQTEGEGDGRQQVGACAWAFRV